MPVESLVEAVDKMDEFFTLERSLDQSVQDLVYDIPSVEDLLKYENQLNRPPLTSSAETVLRFLEPAFNTLKKKYYCEGWKS